MGLHVRQVVWERANSICEYCRMPSSLHPIPFEIDHIIALKHGGATQLDNLALSCFPCNTYKGPNIAGLDPQTDEVMRLFHPRKDRWEEHFTWEGPRLHGLTPTGRATIEVLEINHPDHVALRIALMREGLFPPT